MENFNEIKNDKLFENLDTNEYSITELENAKKVYTYLLESIDIALTKDIPLDKVINEGLLGGLIGGGVGLLLGSSIMKAVCDALGMNKSGVLYDLLTSKLITTAVGAKLGLRK